MAQDTSSVPWHTPGKGGIVVLRACCDFAQTCPILLQTVDAREAGDTMTSMLGPVLDDSLS